MPWIKVTSAARFAPSPVPLFSSVPGPEVVVISARSSKKQKKGISVNRRPSARSIAPPKSPVPRRCKKMDNSAPRPCRRRRACEHRVGASQGGAASRHNRQTGTCTQASRSGQERSAACVEAASVRMTEAARKKAADAEVRRLKAQQREARRQRRRLMAQKAADKARGRAAAARQGGRAGKSPGGLT